MNPITRAIRPWLPALLALVPLAGGAMEDGEWLQRGAPLSEFPACYQLWVCVPEGTDPLETMEHAIGIPRGTWGTCENMMLGEQAGCGRCDAPEPEEECRI